MDNWGIILKKYLCVKVDDYRNVASRIEEFESEGWQLHTYQTAGMGAGPMSYRIEHFLLFEKD